MQVKLLHFDRSLKEGETEKSNDLWSKNIEEYRFGDQDTTEELE